MGGHFKQIILQADVGLCKERNAQRSGRERQPEFSIDQMASTIEYPTEGLIIPVGVGEDVDASTTSGAASADRAASFVSWERHAISFWLRVDNKAISDAILDQVCTLLRTHDSIPPKVQADEEGV